MLPSQVLHNPLKCALQVVQLMSVLQAQGRCCPAQEAKARETITALKGELDTLSSLVESGPERDNEEQIARLMVEKEDLLSERDAQVRGLALHAEMCRAPLVASPVHGIGKLVTAVLAVMRPVCCHDEPCSDAPILMV